MGSNVRSSNFKNATTQAFLEAFSKLKQRVLWKWERLVTGTAEQREAGQMAATVRHFTCADLHCRMQQDIQFTCWIGIKIVICLLKQTVLQCIIIIIIIIIINSTLLMKC